MLFFGHIRRFLQLTLTSFSQHKLDLSNCLSLVLSFLLPRQRHLSRIFLVFLAFFFQLDHILWFYLSILYHYFILHVRTILIYFSIVDIVSFCMPFFIASHKILQHLLQLLFKKITHTIFKTFRNLIKIEFFY